jgi:prevent-host-death family protein
MARYTATEARRQLFDLLDAAEQGQEVILERRGKRFKLILEVQPTKPHKNPVVFMDETLESGEWTWASDSEGQLEFKTKPS